MYSTKSNKKSSSDEPAHQEALKQFHAELRKIGLTPGKIDFSIIVVEKRKILFHLFFSLFENFLKAIGKIYLLDARKCWGLVVELTNPLTYFPGLLNDAELQGLIQQMRTVASQQQAQLMVINNDEPNKQNEALMETLSKTLELDKSAREAFNEKMKEAEEIKNEQVQITEIFLTLMAEATRLGYSTQESTSSSIAHKGLESIRAILNTEVEEQDNAIQGANLGTVNPEDELSAIHQFVVAGALGTHSTNPIPNALDIDSAKIRYPQGYNSLYKHRSPMSLIAWVLIVINHYESVANELTTQEHTQVIASFEREDNHVMHESMTIKTFLYQFRNIATAVYGIANVPDQNLINALAIQKLKKVPRFTQLANKLYHQLKKNNEPKLLNLSLEALFEKYFEAIDEQWHLDHPQREEDMTKSIIELGLNKITTTRAPFDSNKNRHRDPPPRNAPNPNSRPQHHPSRLNPFAQPFLPKNNHQQAESEQICRNFLMGKCFRKDCSFVHNEKLRSQLEKTYSNSNVQTENPYSRKRSIEQPRIATKKPFYGKSALSDRNKGNQVQRVNNSHARDYAAPKPSTTNFRNLPGRLQNGAQANENLNKYKPLNNRNQRVNLIFPSNRNSSSSSTFEQNFDLNVIKLSTGSEPNGHQPINSVQFPRSASRSVEIQISDSEDENSREIQENSYPLHAASARFATEKSNTRFLQRPPINNYTPMTQSSNDYTIDELLDLAELSDGGVIKLNKLLKDLDRKENNFYKNQKQKRQKHDTSPLTRHSYPINAQRARSIERNTTIPKPVSIFDSTAEITHLEDNEFPTATRPPLNVEFPSSNPLNMFINYFGEQAAQEPTVICDSGAAVGVMSEAFDDDIPTQTNQKLILTNDQEMRINGIVNNTAIGIYAVVPNTKENISSVQQHADKGHTAIITSQHVIILTVKGSSELQLDPGEVQSTFYRHTDGLYRLPISTFSADFNLNLSSEHLN